MGFDATALWVIGIGASMLFAGLYVGYLFRGRDAQAREAQLQSEIGGVRDSFDEHKRRVTKHFERSSDLFRDLTRHYAALYTHLSQGARDFCKGTSPSLGVELQMLLSEGEVGAGGHGHVANDYGLGARVAAPPPGAPPPGPSQYSFSATRTEHQASPSSGPGNVPTGAPTGDLEAGVAESSESMPASDAGAGEATAVVDEAPATAKRSRSDEGIGDWLARLDTQEREEEAAQAPSFDSGYELPPQAGGQESHPGRGEYSDIVASGSEPAPRPGTERSVNVARGAASAAA